MDTFTTEYRDGKWCVINEVGQTVVTVEPPAEDCENLANHIASFMTQILRWS